VILAEKAKVMDNSEGPSRRGVVAGMAATGVSGAHAPPGTGGSGFDFLHGRWTVTHRKLRDRLAGSTDWFEFPGTLDVKPILGGLGNVDWNVLQDPSGAFEATSLRVFDPGAGRWTIYWLDGRAPGALEPPVVGGFTGVKGTFFADDSFKGRPIKVRTTYEPLAPGKAQWTQAFSPDGGATWEVNWIMDFAR
jgi:hypothetical protein